MGITAVRLRAREPRKNFFMRTYVSYRCGIKYSAGNGYSPPNWKITTDEAELKELGEIPQFEIKTFDDRPDLDEKIQLEMEENARVGLAPIRAKVEVARPLQRRDLSALKGDDGETEVEEAKDEEASSVSEPPKSAPRKRQAGKKSTRRSGKRSGKNKKS